jgi:hypothetical protein
MTCLTGKLMTKLNPSLSSQLETLQEDLIRLSRFVTQLSDLTDEELAAYDLSDQMQTIHQCIKHFETRCLAIQIATYKDEYIPPDTEGSDEPISQPNNHWTPIRIEARRANKLASQLTSSLGKIRSGFGEYQELGDIPKDVLQINQAVGNAVSGLASDWFTNLD